MYKIRNAEDIQNKLTYYTRKQINEIEYRDYVEIGESEAKTELNKHIGDRQRILAKIKQYTNDVEKMYNRFNEYIEETKPKIDALHLDENSLLFPKKEKKKVREEHIEALKYADNCISIADSVRNSNQVCSEEIGTMLKMEDSVFCSDLAIKSADYSKDAVKQAIDNSVMQSTYSVSAQVTRKNVGIKLDIVENRIKQIPYEIALSLRVALKKENIDTVIVNQSLDKILREKHDNGKANLIEGYQNECASIKQQYQNRKQENKKGLAEFTRGLFTVLFWIGIVLFAMIGLSIAVWGFKGAIPMIVVGSIVVCWLVVMLIYNLKMKKQATKVEKIIADCALLNQILDKYETHFDIMKIHENIDKTVISKEYSKSLELKEQFDFFTKLIYEFTQKVQTAVNEITYLPNGLNRGLLPHMIELLESGSAIDYRSALQLAESR